jgi:excisionase family DNA binding protein
MPSELLTTGQAARRAGVDASTIRRWERSGKLVSSRTPGGDRRIRACDLATALQPGRVDLAAAAPPQVMVPHWAKVTEGWGAWRPPRYLDADALCRLRIELRYLIDDLVRAGEAIDARVRDLDGSGS